MIGDAFVRALDRPPALGRRAEERLPVAAGPQEHPDFVGPGDARQLLDDDVAHRFDVQRSRQRFAEVDEALELERAARGLLGERFGGGFLRLRILALADGVEDEGKGQDQERGRERKARSRLRLAREHDRVVLDRARKNDDQRDRQTADQCAVAMTGDAHEMQEF